MKRDIFVKNITVTALLFLSGIIFFKIITFCSVPEVLAKYFAIKALASIFFFGLSVRLPEILYILRGKQGHSLHDLKGVHYLFLVGISVGIGILLVVSYFICSTVVVYVAAFFILISNEIVESFMSMQRLFDRYGVMILYRLLLLVKPGILIVLLFCKYITLESATTIIIYEALVFFTLFLIYALYNFKYLFILKKSSIIVRNNIDVVGNTWLASISKISYDALPNYLLSFYASDILYTQYNIARKMYGLIHSAQWSFVQVFNTVSITLKDKFDEYLKAYYKLMVGLNILSFVGVLFLGKFVISLLTKITYATDTTIYLILIFVFMAFVYVLLYPIRQWFILNKLIEENNRGLKISIGILLLLTIITIPIFGVYAASVIQPLGLLTPIVVTLFVLPALSKELIKDQYLKFLGKI
mgnify:FL=1